MKQDWWLGLHLGVKIDTQNGIEYRCPNQLIVGYVKWFSTPIFSTRVRAIEAHHQF
jgi:hypothetical protein